MCYASLRRYAHSRVEVMKVWVLLIKIRAANVGNLTLQGSKIYMRHYIVRLLKSAEGTSPYVQLTEMGPSFDFSVRRMHHAAPEVMKAAMTKPPATSYQPKKVKNISRSALHGRQGRLHVPRQDLTQLATSRMKGLKKRPIQAGGNDSLPKKAHVDASRV